MKQIDLISKSWSDILFENRNKEYGAYVLRNETGQRNAISILSVIIIFGICIALLVAKNAYDAHKIKTIGYEQAIEISKITDKKPKDAKVIRKEIPKQEEVKEVLEKVKSSIKFVAPIIKEDDKVNPLDEMRSQSEIMHSNLTVNFADVQGNDENGALLSAKSVISTEPVKPKEEEDKILTYVEQMPTFPGGQSALMQYLAQHIKYPVIAEEECIQGRVVCTFVVERDGSITDVRVIRSVDPSLDKEAIRVIKSMPKWIPGKQNGHAVRVKFTIPVTFRLS